MRTAILLCLVFFAGLAVGLLVARGMPRRPIASREKPVPTRIEGQPPPATEPQAPQAKPAASPSIHDALASLPLPARQEGAGVIGGSVRTDGATPVPGVVVTAVRDDRSRPARTGKAAASPEADLEREVLELVERRRWTEATRREVRTDPQGEFRIERLAAMRYTLEAVLDGYEIRPAPGEKAQGARPGDTVRFVATPSVSVPVVVFLPDGTQPDSARVELARQERRGGKPKYADWTPAEPMIRLEPGDHVLAAVLGDEGELRSDPVDVTVKAGVAVPPVTLRLRERPGIRGRVIFPPGEAMDTDVFAQRWDSPAPPDYQQLLAVGRGHGARRGEGFRYFFQDLAPGRYVVAATRVEGRVEGAAYVEVQDKIVPQDTVLPALDAGDYVVLWVRGPQGEALSDIDISSGCRNDGASAQGSASWLHRPDGSYWVLYYNSGLCGKRSQDLRYTLAVESRRYGKKEAEYTLPRLEPVIVQFTEPAFLDVFLSGYEGSGNEGFVMLSLRQTTQMQDEKPTQSVSVPMPRSLDSAGRARFGPLEPGACELSLSLKTHFGRGGYGGTEFASISFALRPGDNAETVPMPSLHSLTVLVEDPKPDTRLNLRQLMDSGTYGGIQLNDEPVGEDSQLTFQRLPAGKYQLSTSSGYRDGEMVVRVPGQATVRYDPQPRDALRVYISDPGGVLARAGFKTGDLVVGLDGTAFTEEAQMQATMKSVALKEEVKLRVLRGNEALELSFDPRLQDRSDQLGGFLWASCR